MSERKGYLRLFTAAALTVWLFLVVGLMLSWWMRPSHSWRVDLTELAASAGAALFIGLLLTAVAFVKFRQMGPLQVFRMWRVRHAMLEAVREGILAIDAEGRIVIANAEANRVFRAAGLTQNPIGQDVQGFLPRSRLGYVLLRGMPLYDQDYDLNGTALLVNYVPVRVNGRILGAIATFRDKTEMKQLADKLTGASFFAEALRVQTHEFMNKLHVILGLLHTGQTEELVGYVERISDAFQVEVGAVSSHVKEPILAGFLLSKLSLAREHNVQFSISADGVVLPPLHPEVIDDIITIVGNLVDNSFDAVQTVDHKQIVLSLRYADYRLAISVWDNGGGIQEKEVDTIFEKGYSSKGDSRGYGLYLVQKTVERCGGRLELATGPNWTRFEIQIPYVSSKDSTGSAITA